MKTKRCHILVCLTLALCLVQAAVAGQWHALSHLTEHEALAAGVSGVAEVASSDTDGGHRLCDLCLAWKVTQLAGFPVSDWPLAFLPSAPSSSPAPSHFQFATTQHHARGPPVSRFI